MCKFTYVECWLKWGTCLYFRGEGGFCLPFVHVDKGGWGPVGGVKCTCLSARGGLGSYLEFGPRSCWMAPKPSMYCVPPLSYDCEKKNAYLIEMLVMYVQSSCKFWNQGGLILFLELNIQLDILMFEMWMSRSLNDDFKLKLF